VEQPHHTKEVVVEVVSRTKMLEVEAVHLEEAAVAVFVLAD